MITCQMKLIVYKNHDNKKILYTISNKKNQMLYKKITGG